MTITLNGTTGITTPAGTIQGDLTTTGNTVLGDASTDTLNVANGGLVKDSSGNLGLGVTPSAWGNVKAFESTNAVSLYSRTDGPKLLGLSCNSYYNGTNNIYKTSEYASQYIQYAGTHIWQTAPSGTAGNAISFTQAMTLDSSGNLLVGTTSVPTGGQGGSSIGLNSGNGIIRVSSTATGTTGLVNFNNPNGNVGYIATNGSSTSYVTSSDYRLKENIEPMTGALAVVGQLKPCTYTWKTDGSSGQGFIAHELQAVVPDCVTGEKDAVDADGNPVYQGIDTSFLVATLTAAIQELKAELDTVKTELATLKGTA